MNILFMADVPEGADSGAAGTEYQTIRALRSLGHEVDAIWADSLSHRIKHGNLHSLCEQPLAYRRVLIERLRHRTYDVVHVNQPQGYLAAKALKRLDGRSAFIHRSHGLEPRVARDLKRWEAVYLRDERPGVRKLSSKLLAGLLSYSNRAIARFADGHIVSAVECAAFLRDEMGVPPERIAVIPQAAPTLYIETPAPRMDSRRMKKVLYAGQFAFFKAPMIVASAMNDLAERVPGMEFTWVCSSRHHEDVRGLLTPTLRARLKLLDWMPQSELMKTYDGHGVFLFPSFFEGFGKAFLEAMSRGLCVIASDNGGARDVISSGTNGFLVETGNARAVVERCLTLISNQGLAGELSTAAAQVARAYTWNRVAAETAAFYESRLGAKTSRAIQTTLSAAGA